MSKTNAVSRLCTIFSPKSNTRNSIKSKLAEIQNPKKSKTPIYDPIITVGIKELLDEKDSKKLVEKFKSLSSYRYFRNKYKIYDFVINRLALAKQYTLIEEALESQKNYISGDGWGARIIYLYGKSGMFDHAQKMFDELPEQKCGKKMKSFSALLGAAANTGKYAKVIELFRELRSKMVITPNVDAYNIVANAYCKLGLLDDAVSILDEMENDGLKPVVVSFNTVFGEFYRKGMFEEGEKVWERMIKSGVEPDIISYNFKLLGLVNVGKFPEAMELTLQFESKGLRPDVGTYNSLILRSCKKDDLEGVKKWYGELLNGGCIPNRVTFNTIVPFLCEKGDYGSAFQVCKRMFRRQCSVDESLMQKVVDGLVKDSKAKEAQILVGLGRSNTYFPYNLVFPSKGFMGFFT